MFLAIAIGTLPVDPALAQSGDDVFTVEDVTVDATAQSAAAARETALANGQAEALRRLFARLVPRQQWSALPRPSGAEIADMVRGLEVEGEKTSSVRYIASLRVRFDADSVRRLLRQRGLPFAETRSKPVVVLPVLQTGSGPVLWEQPTPWRDAWSMVPRNEGLVPLVVPYGDLDDVIAANAEQAVTGDSEAIARVAARYDAGDVVVAIATPGGGTADAPTSLQVSVGRYGATGQDETVVQRFTADPAAGGDIWSTAADTIAATIQDAWKRSNLIRFDSEQSLVVSAPLAGIEELVDLRRRLGGVATLRNAELVYLARDEARFRLNFLGDAPQLAVALAQRDLRLEQGVAGWTLTPARRAPAGTARSAAPPNGPAIGPATLPQAPAPTSP